MIIIIALLPSTHVTKAGGDWWTMNHFFDNVTSIHDEENIMIFQTLQTYNISQFKINTIQFPNLTCLMLFPGDGDSYLINSKKESCSASGELSQNTILKNMTNFIVEHQFTKTGIFLSKLILINSQRMAIFVEKQIFIPDHDCSEVHIDILNLSKNISNPTDHMKSLDLIVHLDTSIRCEFSPKYSYKWTILRIDKSSKKLYSVEKDPSWHRENSNRNKKRHLHLNTTSLQYGLYQLHARVVLQDTKRHNVEATAVGYLHIISSPIHAVIDGGSLVRRTLGDFVLFDGKNSYDPDDPDKRLAGMYLSIIFIFIGNS